MRSTRTLGSRRITLGAVLICAVTLFAGDAKASDESNFGFYRTVVGEVRLTTLERAEPIDIEPDYPLLLGDRLWVSPGGRIEAVLPDQTILRADGSTDLYFEDLALYAGETVGTGTVLRLLEGEVQVVVRDTAWEGEPLRVDTANAVVYLERAGTYRIYSDERNWTEVVVRDGFAEVVLPDGSVVVRSNEEAVIDGETSPRVRVYPAGPLDALEAWGDELEREAQLAATDTYVDESLRYEAAPLRHHGEWLQVDAGYAWRPYVSVSWRPYHRGYWTHTPGGYYWVSADPWGGFTSHYGSWRLHPYHGWIWHPGAVFSPAWVTWYWGPTHVGWVPSGYYSHHYSSRGYLSVGLRFGYYGWAGGSWGYYSDWTFCPTRYFGWRSYQTQWRSGAEIAHTARHEVPRGVITGTTRGIPRGFTDRPESLIDHLRRERGGSLNASLPDVTGFVARRSSLSSEVRDAVFATPGSPRSMVDRLSPRGTDAGGLERPSSPRTPSRMTTPRISVLERESERSGSASVVRSLPARPDVTRREIATGATAPRQPQPRAPRGVVSQPSSRTVEPASPRSSDSAGDRRPPSSFVDRSFPSRPSAESAPPPRPSSDVRQPAPPSAREAAPSAGSAPPVAKPRLPIVRRVLDGIRGTTSSSSRSTPSASSATPSRPSSPPPPSASSRRPSSPTPSTSRSSSGSSSRSVRKPAPSSSRSSSSSSSSSRSSAKPRSQSPPKSKPPR